MAVEEKVITEGGKPRRVEVPVEMPEGMSYEGVFGKENRLQAASASVGMMVADRAFIGSRVMAMPAPPPMALPQAQASASNLDPVIAALISRAKAGGRPSVDETKFVFGNEAYIDSRSPTIRPRR